MEGKVTIYDGDWYEQVGPYKARGYVKCLRIPITLITCLWLLYEYGRCCMLLYKYTQKVHMNVCITVWVCEIGYYGRSYIHL